MNKLVFVLFSSIPSLFQIILMNFSYSQMCTTPFFFNAHLLTIKLSHFLLLTVIIFQIFHSHPLFSWANRHVFTLALTYQTNFKYLNSQIWKCIVQFKTANGKPLSPQKVWIIMPFMQRQKLKSTIIKEILPNAKGTIVHVLNLTLHTKACKIILFTKEIIPKTTSNFPTVPLYPPITTES